MPYELEFTIRVTVESEEEAILLNNAVYSGYAAEIMKIGVLYGQIPVMGSVNVGNGGLSQQEQAARQQAAAVELKRVETRKTNAPIQAPVQETPRPRPSGLAGRKRIGRT